jgi:peptidoglycan/xylan/chitin deacetylase (PgdA/CDA1 family)
VTVTACSHGVSPKAHTRPAGTPLTVPPGAATTVVRAGAEPKPQGVVVHGSRTAPLVALTFDTNMTGAMLAELDRHQVASFDNSAAIAELERLRVPATIFLAGRWVERYPDETRRLAANTLFELASHSYAHRAFHAPCYGLGPAMPAGEMAADVTRSEDVLRRFTDHPTPYFRFPGGCYDQSALDAIRPTGAVVIQYDVASGDAFGHSVTAIVDNVLRSTKNGSIVVMHLTGGNTAPLTARALPAIVEGLRARGLTLVKVSELLSAPSGKQ